MGNRTAIVDIEYIDYMVARNLLSVVDDWFKLIPVAPEWTLINALQSYSEFFAPVARFFTTLFVALVAIQFLPIFVKRDTADLLGFGYFLGFSLLVIYAAYTLTDWFARILEAAIDSYRGRVFR